MTRKPTPAAASVQSPETRQLTECQRRNILRANLAKGNAMSQINPAIRLATEKVSPPREKLKIMVDMVLSFLEKDAEVRTVFLLEGPEGNDSHPQRLGFSGLTKSVCREYGSMKVPARGVSGEPPWSDRNPCASSRPALSCASVPAADSRGYAGGG